VPEEATAMGKLAWVFGGVFGGVGLALLTGAVLAAWSTIAFRQEAIAVSGKVVDFERSGSSYRPVVDFADAEGVEHRVVGSVASNPPAYDRGETVTVRYRPSQVDDARIDGFMQSWFLPTLLGGMGLVFGAVGAGFLVYEIRKRRLRAWLGQYGMRVQAQYTGVRLDTSVSVNRRHPWRLTAQWQNPVTGNIHTFESDMLFYDPSEYVRRDTLEVLIDADDPNRHYIDLGFLPKHA
jgi:hypothetical protein